MTTDRKRTLGSRIGCQGLLFCVLLLSACATSRIPIQPWPELAGVPIELASVPFFPQQAHQCGPAALATVLVHYGQAVTPEMLTPALYIPAQEGSLQLEMLAQARAHGLLAYALDGGPAALLAEIRAGHPVVVLQNNGLDWLPRWHYAVVIGVDSAGNVILRSGTERRHVLAPQVFARTWRRGNYWGLVALPPGELPVSATPLAYARASSDLETTQSAFVALPAWQAGVMRWPENLLLGFGLGNNQYAQGVYARAITAYQRVLRYHPQAAVVWNNLATALAADGQWAQAETAARRAIALGGPHAAEFAATLAQILQEQHEAVYD